ncbi:MULTISPECIES: hypothetical protein [unclassified Caballeronia]|uniref:hypothetical protein n=1 Tax=unclassified Caballeronia TaxID=2646786 RepID=UPI002028AD91|nr:MULTISPECIES: hypothetical protein [unclassified Caballeronia]
MSSRIGSGNVRNNDHVVGDAQDAGAELSLRQANARGRARFRATSRVVPLPTGILLRRLRNRADVVPEREDDLNVENERRASLTSTFKPILSKRDDSDGGGGGGRQSGGNSSFGGNRGEHAEKVSKPVNESARSATVPVWSIDENFKKHLESQNYSEFDLLKDMVRIAKRGVPQEGVSLRLSSNLYTGSVFEAWFMICNALNEIPVGECARLSEADLFALIIKADQEDPVSSDPDNKVLRTIRLLLPLKAIDLKDPRRSNPTMKKLTSTNLERVQHGSVQAASRKLPVLA